METDESGFGWLSLVDRYRDVTGECWKDIWDVQISEFLNIVSYSIWRANKAKEAIEQWKKTN